jgi:5'-methylthioadenosine phosphorylase
MAPGFDPDWRAALLDAAAAAGIGLGDGGVYWQTNGPRFETPAEIRMMAPHAELVGMTIAAECVVAGDRPITPPSVVDNLANGLGEGALSVAEMEADRAANASRLRDGLAAVLPRLGAVGR